MGFRLEGDREQSACYIGIDIGGTKIAGGVVSTAGQVLARSEQPTPVKEGGKAILAASIAVAQKLLTEQKLLEEQKPLTEQKNIGGIGIGAGGQIDADNGVVFSATDVLPGWRGLEIARPFSAACNGLPVKVDNDVNVLPLGEQRFGAASAFTKGTVLYLALGTGVGGALVVDGRIHHGAHWSGGEFGHIILSMDPNARRDLGGAAGTLEAFCSGPGLVQTWRELSGSGGGSDSESGKGQSGQIESQMTGHNVVADAEADPHGFAAQAITKTGEYLGFGLASLANALDPDCIIIGGGLAELGEKLLGPARIVLKKYALPGPGSCKVVTAALGNNSAIIGAACLVMPSLVVLATPARS
jgi:glucokinase